MIKYIQLTNADAIRLNNLMFNKYVKDSEGNFIFPFQEGTIAYIDTSQTAFIWVDLMDFALTDVNQSQSDRDWLASLKADAKTEAEALIAGWIDPPPYSTSP